MEAEPPDCPEHPFDLIRCREKLGSFRPGNHSWPINMAEKIGWQYGAHLQESTA